MRVKSDMGLKVWSNLGLAQKKKNHTVLEALSKIMLKVFSLMGICDSWFNFRKKYSKMRVSELESAQNSIKLGRVNQRQARSSWFHASERAKRSLSQASNNQACFA